MFFLAHFHLQIFLAGHFVCETNIAFRKSGPFMLSLHSVGATGRPFGPLSAQLDCPKPSFCLDLKDIDLKVIGSALNICLLV